MLVLESVRRGNVVHVSGASTVAGCIAVEVGVVGESMVGKEVLFNPSGTESKLEDVIVAKDELLK